jgi:putative peptidoglycan lipid II flippase
LDFKPQTAIRGIFSVGLINTLARIIAYGKHFVITAYIGLSAQLDAFYVAATILAMVVFVFGDVFDSLGIPRLVKALREEGEEGFRAMASPIFSFSLVLSAIMCLLLFLISPWTPWIAPGLSAEKKELVLRNLYYLFPMAFLYLPYHAVGSFLRAKRRFQAFYVGELIIASTTFLILYVWRDAPYIIPISFSAAYLIVFAYIVAISMQEIRLVAVLGSEDMRGLFRMLLFLLPLYLTGHLFTLVDRAFASFLPTGGISALSYGAMISMIPCSILMLENIFVTPLSEASDREPMMNDILSGVLIVSIPIAFFSAVYSDQIVKAAFERGLFTSVSTRMTGDALAYLSIAIPAFFIWPLCYRLFQILEKLFAIGMISLFAVFLNAALNYLFLKMGLGIKGLALATAVAWYTLVIGGSYRFFRLGITLFKRNVLQVLLISVGVSAVSLAVSLAFPIDAETTAGLLVTACVYCATAACLYHVLPNERVRHIRKNVLGEAALLFTRKRS